MFYNALVYDVNVADDGYLYTGSTPPLVLGMSVHATCLVTAVQYYLQHIIVMKGDP